MHLETELMGTVRERAEDEAINVFARNLHDLLMAAPAGLRATMGLDPGLRTGVKVAVVDGTGKLVATDTIYPHTGQAAKAAVVVAALCEKYNVELVAIGNGTASRETERFYLDVQKQFPKVTAQKVIVSEAGHLSIPPLSWQRRSSRNWTFPCAVRSLSPVVCRIRWRSW